MLKIIVRHDSAIPLDFQGILPENLESLTKLEIGKRPVQYGNRTVELGEIAKLTGDPSDGQLWFGGDTGRVKQLGARMTRGTIWIENDAGWHAGAQMEGGLLTIHGSAGDWLGAEMRGGKIEVYVDAGNNVGAGYRGSRRGMLGGSIRIRGNASDEVGSAMRRGMIGVDGRIGCWAAAGMIAGTIFAGKGFGTHPGAGLKRGTLISGVPLDTLPLGYRFACDFQPAFWPLLNRAEKWLPIDRTRIRCYRGDILTGTRGELWVVG